MTRRALASLLWYVSNPSDCRRFGGGVPCKQYNLIGKDRLSIASYVARTMDGVAQNSHLRSDNYFYFNCLTGRCARQLKETVLPLRSTRYLRLLTH